MYPVTPYFKNKQHYISVSICIMRSMLGLSLLGTAASAPSSPLWPAPVSAGLGEETLTLSADFAFKQDGSTVSPFLSQAIDRYTALIHNGARGVAASGAALSSCGITVEEVHDNEPDTLQPGVDQSYSLSIDSEGACSISSKTVWGALHGMETFTQLLERSSGSVTCPYVPATISDSPRFTHRGMLIDSSRHFLPVSEIERLIDALPMSKFNVLHWHMVDAQVRIISEHCFAHCF